MVSMLLSGTLRIKWALWLKEALTPRPSETKPDKWRWHWLSYGLLPQGKHFVRLMYNPDTCFSNSHMNSNLQTGLLKALWNVYLCSGRITGLTVVQPLLFLTWGCSHATKCHIQVAEFAYFHWWALKSGWHTWLFVLCSNHYIEPPGLTDWYLNTLPACLGQWWRGVSSDSFVQITAANLT